MDAPSNPTFRQIPQRPLNAVNSGIDAPGSPMSKPVILVADDSRTLRTLVRRILGEAGYAVALAADGREALELAFRERPDLVVLDIHMPGMDGYEACQELLGYGPPWNQTPIIFLTHAEGPHLSALGTELGAYLRKPVNPDLLIPTVRRLLDSSGDTKATCRAAVS
jgi:CheY-like chemotaxis protein